MKKKLTYLLFLILLKTFNLQAQIDSLMNIYVTDFDSTGFIFFTPESIMPGQPYSMYRLYSGDTLHKLELKKQWTDSILEMQHYRYQQTYRNLRVETAEYSEHASDGYLVFANGKFVEFPNDYNFIPYYTEQQALNLLLDSLYEYDFAWNNQDWEDDLKIDLDDSNATYYPDGELLWALEDYKNLTCKIPVTKYRLAWRIEILCLDPSFNKAFYVDGVTGEIFREEQLRHSDGPAEILTQGNQTIDTRWKGGLTARHILWANNNNRDIHTKYYSSFWTWGLISDIKDRDDDWGTSEQLGTTLHWMVSQAWDFYSNPPYNLIGMDGNGSELRIMADAGSESAYYTQNKKEIDFIVIGDVDNNYASVIDVVGHEFTHGVTNYSANLTYQDESGALNESFSDIFGFLIERFTEGGVTDWLIGEDGNFTVNHTRSLNDPNNWGEHIDGTLLNVGQPDTWNGLFWYNGTFDYGGVHVNSGVQNFWFNLLSVGGNGTNDNNDNYSLQGIDIDNAALIAYWSLTNILQSGSQFADAREGAIVAARLLFGECSLEEIETTNAWAAVGVGNRSNCPPLSINNNEINNPIIVYPNPASEFINISFPNITECRIYLYSCHGSLVLVNDCNGSQNVKINTNSLSKGIYFLKIQSTDQMYSFKFMKN